MIDVAIIGAGIHGAGIALSAAAAGYSVGLFEQFDSPAQGTSSRSSKLIHGGLRYLASGQFALVRECLRERRILLHNAPDLVRLVPFYIPIYKLSRYKPSWIAAGLSLYALLGGMRVETRFAWVPRKQWNALDGLNTQQLSAVFRYFDAQTDDALLTRAVLTSALNLGAELHLESRVTSIQLRPRACELHFERQRRSQSCQAWVVINATGPWVNRVLERVEPQTRQLSVELVQGTHIVVPGALSKGIYYVEAPSDKRPVFIMPWRGHTLIGTTEKPFLGDPACVHPTPEEVAYLLATLAHYFPQRAYMEADILEAFAGLRCLPITHGSIGERSRETVLLTDQQKRPRLLTVYGGKLTAFRATADAVLTRIRPSLPARQRVADTRRIRIGDRYATPDTLGSHDSP